ncbi:MAG: Hint domain-containing protein [Pseudomonadota bacterium]
MSAHIIDHKHPVGFTPGTFVQTVKGLRPVERLVPGEDRLEVLDGSDVALLAMTRVEFNVAELRADPTRQPVFIPPAALGSSVPARPLIASQNTRIHAKGRLVNRVTECPEVLLPIAALIGTNDVERRIPEEGVTYYHLITEAHHLLRVEGLMCETLFLEKGDELAEILAATEARHETPAMARIDMALAQKLTSKLVSKQRAPTPEPEEG